MYYDGHNLETETEKEVDQLFDQIKKLGHVTITEHEYIHQIDVAHYSFYLQRGTVGVSIFAWRDEDEASAEILYRLYISLGGSDDKIGVPSKSIDDN